MSVNETMTPVILHAIKVVELSPLGYGNPNAKIRYSDEQGETDKLAEQLKEAGAEILRSGECLIDVTESDDGCIDGREAVIIHYTDHEGAKRTKEVDSTYLREREKVAGGGYVTGMAMKLAIRPPRADINESLRATVIAFAEKDVYCGAHSGAHQVSGATDCGANDKMEAIFENGLLHGESIAVTTQELVEFAGVDYSPEAQFRSREGWAHALQMPRFFKNSTGESRLDTILDTVGVIHKVLGSEEPVAVSKHLAGKHNEKFIFVNLVESKTLSQANFRQKLQELFPAVSKEKLPQVFVVDVPRIVKLTKALTDDADERQVTLQSGVAYQLATAATLTDGSLRVFAAK
ncbi:MAG: hypothetical protein ABIR46_02050 [Candidatus Saccharimonadales bacterium]